MTGLPLRHGRRPAQPHRRKAAPRRSEETALQIACVDLTWKIMTPWPEGPVWTAINPSPAKSKAVAGLSKAMGLVAGWTDLIYLWRSTLHCCELKRLKGGRTSDAQDGVHAGILAQGGTVDVVRSLPEFHCFLLRYGMPVKRIRSWIGDAPVVEP